MILSPILILMLSCQGYWIGGQQGVMTACYVVPSYPPAVIHWRLVHGQIELSSGQLLLEPRGRPTRLTLDVPVVRAITTMTIRGEIRAQSDGRTLGQFERQVTVYPGNLPDAAMERAHHRLAVIADSDEPLAQLLDSKGFGDVLSDTIPAVTERSIVVVGPMRQDLSGFAQNQLLDLVRQGAQVLVLYQGRQKLFGYTIVRRPVRPGIDWNSAHPLLSNMEDVGLNLLVAEDELDVFRIAADGDIVSIAGWPGEMPGRPQQAYDYAVISKSIGRGRLVLCQIPMNDWLHDPRQQQFLAGALDYLATPPLLPEGSFISQSGGVP